MSIKFEHTEVVGWEAAIRGMRNPMNSWEKSDSGYRLKTLACHSCKWNRKTEVSCKKNIEEHVFVIGKDDLDLMKQLCNAGTDHRKFMRMIVVYVDITAPLYWWKEFDTYKVGTVANSCSTMHKIHAKEFTLEDFSTEHLYSDELEFFKEIIERLNGCRNLYLESKKEESARIQKNDWWQMIQLLPSSYNQKRTVMMNYEVLANIYKSRKNHRLDEWAETKLVGDCPANMYPNKLINGFCDWIKTLPYSELITGEVEMENENTDNQINIKQICTPNEIRRIFGLEPIEKEEL